MMDQDRKCVTYGVGISSNITRASLRGIFSAVNRLYGDNRQIPYIYIPLLMDRKLPPKKLPVPFYAIGKSIL